MFQAVCDATICNHYLQMGHTQGASAETDQKQITIPNHMLVWIFS